MNNETLKRDLCARLMEGVKVQIESDLFGTYKDIMCSEYIDIVGKLPIKPYLFPTSALTKPIQMANYNNGEPFLPLDIINEEIESTGIEIDYDTERGITFSNSINNVFGMAYELFEILEYLRKWHINYRLSPDQFIEVTDEFNPYK